MIERGENRNPDALVAALESRGLKVKGKSAQCPWHDDQNPSAEIKEGKDGVWRVTCYACGKWGDVFDLSGQAFTPEVPGTARIERTPPPAREVWKLPSLGEVEAAYPTKQAVYKYTNPDTGLVDMVVVRFPKPGNPAKKSFSQWSPIPGGWQNCAPPKPWPLYNRSQLRTTSMAIVVEGEKCVHALREAGIVATSSPCGAGKGANADWSPLAGKVVYLWPDNDPVDPITGKSLGIEHMREIQGILERLSPPCIVYWVDPAALDLPPKGDVFDLLERMPGATKETKGLAVVDALSDARPIGSGAELSGLMEAIIAGKHKAIDWHWPRVGQISQALLPGTVTLLCGDPGSTKSFFLLEAMANWHNAGIPVALFELEEDRRFHLHRAMAQRARDSRFMNTDWIVANPDIAREILHREMGFLNGFGSRIWEAPEKQVTLTELAEWARDRSKEGARVLAIDPVTVAVGSKDPWNTDGAFVMAIKSIARQYKNSVILVTHPTKGVKTKGAPGQVSGGAAYMRFCQTALWLEACDEAPNRALHVMKARNGKGAGMAIAMEFSGATLCFDEIGIKGVVPAPSETRPRKPETPNASEDMFA